MNKDEDQRFDATIDQRRHAGVDAHQGRLSCTPSPSQREPALATDYKGDAKNEYVAYYRSA